MGQPLSCSQLKTQIQRDLGIYFYFPFFDKTALQGDTACCTVSKIETFCRTHEQD
jgi:hypothetical protein